ncbi:MAG: PD40 domain-containing protein [Anaerolineae bacterium]|nr:PD40 domain-containing protein [Anaerolineae bacterium]
MTDIDQTLRQAASLAKSGQREQARGLILDILRTSPNHVVAWWGLANITTSAEERSQALHQVLRLQPDHSRAQEMLARLSVPSKPDFEELPLAPDSPPTPTTSRRFRSRTMVILGCIVLLTACVGVATLIVLVVLPQITKQVSVIAPTFQAALPTAPRRVTVTVPVESKPFTVGNTPISIWNTARLVELTAWQAQPNKDSRWMNVRFSPDGSILATSGGDLAIRLWRTADGKPVGQPLTGHIDTIDRLAFSPDGKLLASSDGRTIRLWDVSTGNVTALLKSFEDGMGCITFSPDGKLLASSGKGTARNTGIVRIWDATTNQQVRSFDLAIDGYIVQGCTETFSPDGKFIVVSGEASRGSNWPGRVWFIDIQTGQLRTFNVLKQGRVIFNPANTGVIAVSGPKVATSANNREGSPVILDANVGAMQMQFMDWASAIAFTPDGTILAGVHKRNLRLWDVSTGRPLTSVGTDSEQIDVAINSAGTLIATIHADGKLRLWQITNAKRVTERASGEIINRGQDRGKGYLVNANAGEVLTVTVRATTDALDPAVTIVDVHLQSLRKDAVVAQNDDHEKTDPALKITDAKIEAYLVPFTGSYIIEVTGSRNSRGSYELTIEWATPGQPGSPAGAIYTKKAKFGEFITLESAGLNSQKLRAGDVLKVSLQWTATQPIAKRYTVFIHLLDASGKLVAQQDRELGNNPVNVTPEPSDQRIIDTHDFVLPDNLPPGVYSVEVGVYDSANPAERLRVNNTDRLHINKIQIY